VCLATARDDAEKPVVAFLPCRRGSVRVPDKNTRPFASGRSLLEIKLDQLAQSTAIERIVVSSNDPQVLDVARAFAADCPKPLELDQRPDHLGASETTTDQLIAYVPSIISSGHILWTHVTSPFVDGKTYDHIASEYWKSLQDGYDSLMTGTRIQTFLYSDAGPVNFDRGVLRWPRTQTLPVWWEINSAAFLVERDLCLALGDRVGNRPKILELDADVAFDIDTMSQFALGARLWEQWSG
jgi:CMP-N-acetylneuraminic acid synthetase